MTPSDVQRPTSLKSGEATSDNRAARRFANLYVGAWSEKGGSKGLWHYRLDQWHGKLELVKQISDELDCGFIYVDQARQLLYCTDEADRPIGSSPGGGGGRIFTYRVDPSSGDLTEVGRQNSYGSDPSMVWVDPTGNYVTCSIHAAPVTMCQTMQGEDGGYHIVAASPSANLVLFPRHDNGTLGDPVDIVTYPMGDMPSLLHTCVWEPNGRFFIVADKGKAKIYTYTIDYAQRSLVPTAPPYDLPAGTRPRYVRVHPSKPWFYLNHEAATEVVAFQFDERGNMKKIDEALAVPESWDSKVPPGGRFQQQDLKIDAQGRYLYSVFRGSKDGLDSDGTRQYVSGFEGVAVFIIDQRTGAVRNIQSLTLDCRWPRGCAISPDGSWLIVSCLYSDELITLAIDHDGRLRDTGIRTPQTTAANVTFYQDD